LYHDFLGAVEQCIECESNETSSNQQQQAEEKRAEAYPNDRGSGSIMMHGKCPIADGIAPVQS
jgi:hypothetical protein